MSYWVPDTANLPSSQPSLSLESYCESTPGWKTKNFLGFEKDCSYSAYFNGQTTWLDCDLVDPLLGPASDHCCQCKRECCSASCGDRRNPKCVPPVVSNIFIVIFGLAVVFVVGFLAYLQYESRRAPQQQQQSSSDNENDVNMNDDAITRNDGGTNDGTEEFHTARQTQDDGQ